MKLRYMPVIALCGLASCLAQATDATDTLNQQSANNVQKAQQDPTKQVEKDVNNYIGKANASVLAAGKSHEIQFLSGVISININKNNPDWAEFRSLALQQAMNKARENYLQSINTNVVREQVSSFFQQRGLPEPTVADFENPDKLSGLMDKIIKLADVTIDKMLEKNGVNQKEFKAASPEKKRLLLKKSFANETTTTAFGNLAGMFVVQTYEVFNDDGHGAVGVVMALSARKRDAIKAMIESKGQVSADKSCANPNNANIEQKLAQNEQIYLNEGTNLLYDEQGYPFILSYGQSGVSFSNDPDETDANREAAFSYAEDNAWGALASVYNLNGNFIRKSRQENLAQQEEKFTLTDNGVDRSKSGVDKKIIETIDQSSKMTAEIKNMTGVKEIYRWRKNHPVTGKEMAGVVLIWHPVMIQTTLQLQNGKSADEMNQIESTTDSNSTNHQAQSEDRFNAADF